MILTHKNDFKKTTLSYTYKFFHSCWMREQE